MLQFTLPVPSQTFGDAGTQAAFNYGDALDAIAPGLSTTVAESQAPGESWIDSAAKLANTIVLTVAQKQLLDAQISRAKQGLPPLDASQYGLGVSVGTSPEITNLVKYGLIGALGVAALALFMPRRR